MPFTIIRNDITKVHVDAIVNSANPEPICGDGTDSAVYKAAGKRRLLAERKKIGRIRTGEIAVTKAFSLPAKYIIHTVGPVWTDGAHGEFEDLASCYRKSLLIAEQLGCSGIAFPLISTGVYGFPKDKALTVALKVIREFLDATDKEMDVILVVFDKKSFDLSSALVSDVNQFIDDHYAGLQEQEEYRRESPSLCSAGRKSSSSERRRKPAFDNYFHDPSDDILGDAAAESPIAIADTSYNSFHDSLDEVSDSAIADSPDDTLGYSAAESLDDILDNAAADSPDDTYHKAPGSPSAAVSGPQPPYSAPFKATDKLEDVMGNLGESFQSRLLRLIDERGLTDVQVYKKANLDRKLFSKIRCNENYTPKKSTALALAVALELNLDETVDLLSRAGIALSPGSKRDLIVEYCILHHIFNIFEINALLFDYDQPALGSF